MNDRLGVVGVGVVCLVLVALVPGALAQVRANPNGMSLLPGNPFLPPPCTGIFPDVPCPGGFAVNWIEQYSRDGITAGCGGGLYCPGNPVTRAEMAVFVGKAMRGTANWTPGDLGSSNTGLGADSLRNNSAFAWDSTAIGYQALYTQSFANGDVDYNADNTAVGAWALLYNQPDGGNGNVNGTGNTAVGVQALGNNATGYRNSAHGNYAGYTNVTGWGNTFVGTLADVDVDGRVNATAIGYNAIVDDSNKVVIGNTDVTVIGGQVDWTAFSDLRGKKDVADLGLGLDFVMNLRPVSYRLNNGNGKIDMGFVAQDIEALLGDGYNVLSIGGDPDHTLALRRTDLIAPLVKAVQEQQAMIASQQARIEAQQADLQTLKAQLAEQGRQLQILMAGRQAARETAVGAN